MIVENTPEFIEFLQRLPPNSLVSIECPFCKKTFTRAKNVLQSKLITHKMKNIYCSRACSNKHKIKIMNVQCKQCNKSFFKKADQVAKHPNNFCSSSCSATYSNTHKTKGNRRSKLEIWVESKLKELYPNLDIIFNDKETINSELDIYIRSLNLAFELNGIFHYEPIYGPEKLESIKNNDNRKFQACLERGIELVIIDTSTQKYLKEKTSKKYLDIIINIINIKL